MQNNLVSALFGIRYPIIQGGMVWCSGWKLASAVSNNGGLGLLGAGSMYPDVLRDHIRKMKAATKLPWGVNLPLLYPETEKLVEIIIEEGVKIVFTSAGNPAIWTPHFKENGLIVAHVVSNSRFAMKCVEAGVDAIVAEGFEAGGHNGREEITTMVLLPSVREKTTLPLIAAGGIATGEQIYAAMALGADGVQIGSRFALSEESSAHDLFKNYAIASGEGDTMLSLKKLSPVRLLRNRFFELISDAENRAAPIDELKQLLGKGRAKKGIFEGDLEEGKLEIGQVASFIDKIQPVSEIFRELIAGYNKASLRLPKSLE